MSDPNEPIHHKLAEAIPPVPSPADAIEGHPGPTHGNPGPLGHTDQKQHNAEAHLSRTDHLVEVGRGKDTTGRGSERDASQ